MARCASTISHSSISLHLSVSLSVRLSVGLSATLPFLSYKWCRRSCYFCYFTTINYSTHILSLSLSLSPTHSHSHTFSLIHNYTSTHIQIKSNQTRFDAQSTARATTDANVQCMEMRTNARTRRFACVYVRQSDVVSLNVQSSVRNP